MSRPVAESSTDEVSFGIAPARTGVDCGYGVADWVVLGARLSLLHRSAEVPGGAERDTTTFAFLPHVDFVFPSSSNTRLFVGPMGGVGLETEDNASSTIFIFGGAFGAHIFVSDTLSFDPRLNISYAFGSISFDADTGGLVETTRVDADVRVLSMSALFGISGWL